MTFVILSTATLSYSTMESTVPGDPTTPSSPQTRPDATNLVPPNVYRRYKVTQVPGFPLKLRISWVDIKPLADNNRLADVDSPKISSEPMESESFSQPSFASTPGNVEDAYYNDDDFFRATVSPEPNPSATKGSKPSDDQPPPRYPNIPAELLAEAGINLPSSSTEANEDKDENLAEVEDDKGAEADTEDNAEDPDQPGDRVWKVSRPPPPNLGISYPFTPNMY